MYHFTSLTCCKDHKKKGGKAINLGAGEGGGKCV